MAAKMSPAGKSTSRARHMLREGAWDVAQTAVAWPRCKRRQEKFAQHKNFEAAGLASNTS